jgi:predicted RNA-binding Zn-ribbon protein involved in translation (DUF1610 family)
MSARCQLCRDERVVRLPLYLPLRHAPSSAGAGQVTSEPTHRAYPCPECGDARLVPASRIKRLSVSVHYAGLLPGAIPDTRSARHTIGQAIAEKLFEFDKVLLVERGGAGTFHAEIDVIVPEKKPDERPERRTLVRVVKTAVSVELYVGDVRVREWLGCGDWNVEAAERVAADLRAALALR